MRVPIAYILISIRYYDLIFVYEPKGLKLRLCSKLLTSHIANEIPCISACVHAKWLQSCMTVCDGVDCSLTGSSVHGILRQEYWSGFPWPPPVDLLDPGIKLVSLLSAALADGFFTTSAAWESHISVYRLTIVYISSFGIFHFNVLIHLALSCNLSVFLKKYEN